MRVVARMIGVLAGTIGKDIKACQMEHEIILPYRRTAYDTGPSMTYKKIRILHGMVKSPAIARMLMMSEGLVKEYIALFEEYSTIGEDRNHVS